jgi:hypothetical protein
MDIVLCCMYISEKEKKKKKKKRKFIATKTGSKKKLSFIKFFLGGRGKGAAREYYVGLGLWGLSGRGPQRIMLMLAGY